MTSTQLKVSEAAALAGVSDDTVRRWAESGRLDLIKGESGPSLVTVFSSRTCSRNSARSRRSLRRPGPPRATDSSESSPG